MLKKIFNLTKAGIFLIYTLTLNHALASGKDIPDPKILVKLGMQVWEKQGEHFLVVNYENYPNWHTYWKNPGDAGLPLKTKFTIDGQPAPLEEMEWPAPSSMRKRVVSLLLVTTVHILNFFAYQKDISPKAAFN